MYRIRVKWICWDASNLFIKKGSCATKLEEISRYNGNTIKQTHLINDKTRNNSEKAYFFDFISAHQIFCAEWFEHELVCKKLLHIFEEYKGL